MASVSVSLADVEHAERMCMGAIGALNDAAKKLDDRYNAAGQSWRDNKYKQLGDVVNDCTNAMRSPIDELFECVQKLREIEKRLAEYESINI